MEENKHTRSYVDKICACKILAKSLGRKDQVNRFQYQKVEIKAIQIRHRSRIGDLNGKPRRI